MSIFSRFRDLTEEQRFALLRRYILWTNICNPFEIAEDFPEHTYVDARDRYLTRFTLRGQRKDVNAYTLEVMKLDVDRSVEGSGGNFRRTYAYARLQDQAAELYNFNDLLEDLEDLHPGLLEYAGDELLGVDDEAE